MELVLIGKKQLVLLIQILQSGSKNNATKHNLP